MKEYGLYLFDFDNTLYDTSAGIRDILVRAFPAAGVDFEESMFPGMTGLSMDQVFDRYIGDPGVYDAYRTEFMRAVGTDSYLSGVPFPETPEVLKGLSELGKHVGIVSGKMSYKIENLLRRDGLLDFVECIVGFGDTERMKPHPDPVLKGLSFFDVPVENAVYIGDSPNDPQAARNAGMDSVVVNRGTGLTPDGLECTYEVDSLRPILDSLL